MVKLPHFSLLTVLTVPFILQIVTVTGLVGYLSFANGQQAVNEVVRQLHTEINTRIQTHLHDFLTPPRQINQLNVRALTPGWSDPAALEQRLVEQIQVFDSVTSIYFGNTAGGLVDAGREDLNGPLYVIATEGFASGPFHKYALDSQGHRAALLTSLPNFDARTRPWYTGAVAKGAPTWSAVYILFTGQDMALAASQPIYDAQGQLLGVASVDLFLSQLSQFLQTLTIGKTGESFIIEPSGLLLASSTEEKPFVTPEGETTPQRLDAHDSTQPLIRGAMAALTEQLPAPYSLTTDRYFEFDLAGQRQFVQVSPFHQADGLDWLIVTVIPEADFMAQIVAHNQLTLGLMALAIMLTVFINIGVARWISRPIARLSASAQALALGQWLATVQDQSRIGEVSQLTRSFNHMAAQLSASLTQLQQDIAARKQTEEKLRQQRALAEALHNAAGALNSTLDYDGVLEKIMVNVGQVVPIDFANLALLDEAGRLNQVRYHGATAQYPGPVEVAPAVLPETFPIYKQVFETGEPLVVPDTQQYPNWVLVPGREWIRSYAVVPIRFKDKIVGVLNLDSAKPGFYTTEHLEHLRAFANLVATAVENARLFSMAEREIAERKQAAAQLRALTNRLETLVNVAPLAIFTTDNASQVELWNPSAERIFGWPAAEVLGQPNPIVPTAKQAEYAEMVQQVLQGGALVNVETVRQRKDGSLVEVSISSAPLYDAQGHVMGRMAIVADITARKQAEAQLQKQLTELRRWQQVMVGREDRILTLKREVNTLLTQTGQPPRYISVDPES